jgi:hypothetical protein
MRRVRHDGDGSHANPIVARRSTDLFEVARSSAEDRDLDPVITRSLDFGEDGEVLFGHAVRPKEHVEP